jgi:predicted amidohydrolase YtcJ
MDAALLSRLSKVGILKEGNLADIILLSENPLLIQAKDLTEIKVEKTFIGGNLVWDAAYPK